MVQPCSITWWPTVTFVADVRERHAVVGVQHAAVLDVAVGADR
jgi:hypothetical protein